MRFLIVLWLIATHAVGAASESVWVSEVVQPSKRLIDMRQMQPSPEWRPGDPIVEVPRRMSGAANAQSPRRPTRGDDPLVALQRQAPDGIGVMSPPLQNFDAIRSNTSPNDPTVDVGKRHVVVAINSPNGAEFAVYDKVTAQAVVPRTLMRQLGGNSICGMTGRGDGIVLFDEMASRWLFTEFTQSANVLCVYLSDRDDLSANVEWTHYVFAVPAYPDYPKYGVWPNAYFVGANETGTAGQRPMYAIDRHATLAGQPATLQRLTTPRLAGFAFEALQPADLTGSDLLPLPDAPGIFLRHRDDEAHNPQDNDPTRDFLELYEFHVDFQQPANTMLVGPTRLEVAEFSSDLAGLTTFQVFPQPNGVRIDAVREQIMHRVAYRRFPDYEALIANHVTDLSLGSGSGFPDDSGAVRWYELRRSGQTSELFANGFETNDTGGNWAVYQQGTYAPEEPPLNHPADRWLAAVSIDARGNIAMAYNKLRDANPPLPAGLSYTGRRANDPLGVMTQAETTIVAGSGSIGGVRWGDYADMGVDPVDGCTFWFFSNYVAVDQRNNRLASFKFGDCQRTGISLSPDTPQIGICALQGSPTAATPVTISVEATPDLPGPVGLEVLGPLPVGMAASVSPPGVDPPAVATLAISATNAAPRMSRITVRASASPYTQLANVVARVATVEPDSPEVVSPEAGALDVLIVPLFQWSAVNQASSYTITVGTEPTFSSPLFSQTLIGTSLLSPISLPAGSTIYWSVRARNECGQGNGFIASFETRL